MLQLIIEDLSRTKRSPPDSLSPSGPSIAVSPRCWACFRSAVVPLWPRWPDDTGSAQSVRTPVPVGLTQQGSSRPRPVQSRTLYPVADRLRRGVFRRCRENSKAHAVRALASFEAEELRNETQNLRCAATTGRLALAALLLVAGGLLTWAHNFVSDQVTPSSSAQKIFFPPKGSEATAGPEFKPRCSQYAGQQLTTGAQAEAYADHFIAVHLKEVGGGQTYAQLSAKAQADPDDTELAGQVATVFKGETLRGLLLNAYAFGTMGTIAGIAAIVAFVAGGADRPGLPGALALTPSGRRRRGPDPAQHPACGAGARLSDPHLNRPPRSARGRRFSLA